jgi:hypothetical protein
LYFIIQNTIYLQDIIKDFNSILNNFFGFKKLWIMYGRSCHLFGQRMFILINLFWLHLGNDIFNNSVTESSGRNKFVYIQYMYNTDIWKKYQEKLS